MSEPVYIIDCGSGSSRLSKYSYHEDRYIHEDLYIPSGIIPTIAASIAEDKHMDFVKTIKNALMDLDSNDYKIKGRRYFDTMNLIVGATGGLRKALNDGFVKETQIEQFKKILSHNFPSAKFIQYTGTKEAEFELHAVRYIAKHALPGAIPVFTGGRQGSGAIGVLSCGGSSSQVAYFDGETKKDTYLSFRTDLIGTLHRLRDITMLSEKDTVNDKYLKLENSMWELIKKKSPPRKLVGTFVVIELAGSIGKEAGLADRLVPKREAVQLITQHFQTLSLVEGKDNKIKLNAGKTGRTESSFNFFAEARRPLTVIVEGLLSMFSSSSTFFFATSFDIGSSDNILRAQWPLGVALGELTGDNAHNYSTHSSVSKSKL